MKYPEIRARVDERKDCETCGNLRFLRVSFARCQIRRIECVDYDFLISEWAVLEASQAPSELHMAGSADEWRLKGPLP